jgi:hypothetical protein
MNNALNVFQGVVLPSKKYLVHVYTGTCVFPYPCILVPQQPENSKLQMILYKDLAILHESNSN